MSGEAGVGDSGYEKLSGDLKVEMSELGVHGSARWVASSSSMGEATRLRAFRLPDPQVEPTFESFRPFGVD